MQLREDPLLTDAYQFSMVQAYLEHGMTGSAVFEVFVRELPEPRNFLLAAGLEQVLEFLESLHFDPENLAWLKSTQRYSGLLLEFLKDFRFAGDVDAMPEGTPFFPDEPILRITAPLPQAQLLETRILNLLHFQTVIASKAARLTLSAPGKLLIDFGLRRAYGAEAGLLAARAAYLAGFHGTSTVLADRVFGIPSYGTMAHSFIQAHDSETVAFKHFAQAFPNRPILLIDTYDVEAGAAKVIRLARELRAENHSIGGVRLDSGDLARLARAVRAILDESGFSDIKIFASGGLNENRIHTLLAAGAPIDGFGVGTALTTSSDAPCLDCAYKLQEYDGSPRRKKSDGKATLPGKKQVYRFLDSGGKYEHDLLTLATNVPVPQGQPLLEPVIHAGKRLFGPIPLEVLRKQTLERLTHLPARLRGPEAVPKYPVQISRSLHELALLCDRLRQAA